MMSKQKILRSRRVVVYLGKYYINVSIYGHTTVERRFRLTKPMIEILKALRYCPSVFELKKKLGYDDRIYAYTFKLRRQGLLDERDRVTELGEEVLKIIDSASKIINAS